MARPFLPLLLLVSLGASTPPAEATLKLPPTTEELARHEHADGTLTVVGRLSGEYDSCSAGARAFLERRAADGTTLWMRYHHVQPDAPCNQRSGAPLLANLGSLDPDHVAASAFYAVAVDESRGAIYAAGQVLVAWDDGLGTASAWGTLLSSWDLDGNPLQDFYLGPSPAGPAAPAPGCDNACDTTGPGPLPGFGETGARGIALDGQEILLTGWQRAAPGADRDLFVARLAGDPLFPLWVTVTGSPGDEVGHAVVVDDRGEVFVTGFFGDGEHDILLLHLLDDGTLNAKTVLGGVEDDEGHGLTLDTAGRPVVTGLFTQSLQLGPDLLVSSKEGAEHFSGVFSRNLVPLGGQVLPPSPPASQALRASKGRGLSTANLGDPEPPPSDTNTFPAEAVAYSVLTGSQGRGGLAQIMASDNSYLRAFSGPENLLEIEVYFDPLPDSAPPGLDPSALHLSAVRAEILSEHCYTATVLIQDLDEVALLPVVERQLCPAAEPLLELAVDRDLSDQLGFDGQVPLEEKRLRIVLRLEFHPPPVTLPPGIQPQTSGQDSSIDQLSAEIEY
jgi:hypothetical protein